MATRSIKAAPKTARFEPKKSSGAFADLEAEECLWDMMFVRVRLSADLRL